MKIKEEILKEFDKRMKLSKDDDLVTTTRYWFHNFLSQAIDKAYEEGYGDGRVDGRLIGKGIK